jgi:hypothetical protein
VKIFTLLLAKNKTHLIAELELDLNCTIESLISKINRQREGEKDVV